MASSGKTELGDDFTINRLIFANEGLSGGVTLGGTSNNTLTLLASSGQGITITGGSQDTSIGANVVLGNDQSWSNNGTGVLRLSGETISGDGKTLTISGNGNASINSAIRTGNGALIKQGAGVLALNGTNTYTGGTTVSGGTLQGNTRSLQGNIVDNAIVNFDQAAAGTYAGNISGAGSLTKTNSGTLVLAGTNTYTGGTTVTGGALQGTTQSLQGAIVNQSAVVFDQGAAGTYAGNMTGAGALMKIGDGTLVLAGANTYSGGTLVGRGTLQGDSRSLQGDILNQASVVFDQTSNGTYAGNMAGAGSLTKSGGGVLVLGGSNSYTGGTTVGAGTLQGNAQSLQGTIVNQGSVVFDQAAPGAYLGNMSGAGSLVKQGAGVLALGGTNSYSGGTTVAAGALLGNANSIQGNVVNQSVVAFEQAGNGTFGGVMSGSGALVKQGAGVLALTGANTYSGGTLVSAGTLQGTTRSLQGDILNQGAVVFDQNDGGLYAGNMAGIGSLMKQGIGAINITGDFSQFTGATTVAGGLLSINGMMGGSLFVGAGGMLGGNGTVPSVTLQSGSTLAPGMSVGVIRVNGDARFATGSSYRVETEAYGSSDMTFVGGSLLPSGAMVDVRAGGTRRYRPINRYMIAAAGGSVTGTFAGATSNVGYLMPSLQYQGREVFLTLRRNDVDFRAVGARGNQNAVASVLNQLVPTATGSLADHINNVYDLSNGDALQSLNSMTGIQYQHVARSSLDTAQTFMALSLKRLGVVSRSAGSPIAGAGLAVNDLAAANSGASFAGAGQADPVSVKGWWVSGLGGLARYNGNAVDAGARVPTHGLAVGFDGAVTPDLTIGVSGGEAMPEVLLNGADDHTKSRMLQVGFYGRYRKNASRLDGAVSVGNLWNRTWRSITDGVVTPVAGASFGGAAFASQIDYGYSFGFGKGFSFEPAAGLQYGHLTLDGATEDGAGALGLVVPDRRERSRRTLAGGRFGKAFSGPASQFVVEGRASWAHEFSPIRDIRMRFIGDETTSGFDVAAPNQLRDSAVVGFGFAGNRTKHLRIFVNFDGEVSGPLNSWNGNVGVTRSW
jgi:autotransporter-associated beta strand protein